MLLRWQPDMQENRSGNPAVILVVDDEAHIVRVVAFKLRSAGFDVIEAFDGEEAWDRLSETRVDLVLTDRHPGGPPGVSPRVFSQRALGDPNLRGGRGPRVLGEALQELPHPLPREDPQADPVVCHLGIWEAGVSGLTQG